MTSTTENPRDGAFLISEAPGLRSRDQITLLAVNDASTILYGGRVLGQITKAGLTSAYAGTGNGTIGTLTKAANAKVGAYRIVCVEPGTNVGTFLVIDPDGVEIGTAVVAVAFSGAIGFTIADGSTDFISGDTFTVTIAAGSGKHVLLDPAGTDGREVAAGILFGKVDVSGSADQIGTIVNTNAEVKDAALGWGSLSAPQIATAKAQLAALGIKIRSALV